MGRKTTEHVDNLELYLKQINRIFDVPRIINEQQEKSHIIRYYAKNKLTYMLFYDWAGFYHFGISYDGRRKSEDLREQARIIEGYIHDMGASRVLEIGCGLGPNSAFLARRNPHVAFEATDLSNKPLRRFTRIPNLHFSNGDYHDLSGFEDNSFDIIFAIETLCYSTDKLQVFREVKKKLRPGGKFIIFDHYQSNRARPLSPSEDIVWQLFYKVTAVQKIERVSDVQGYMREEFSIAEARDLSPCILPFLYRQESLVRFYFNHPLFAKVSNKFIPLDMIKNAILALLLPTTVRRQIDSYYMHVLINDR
ncbi:MAG: class I SAM-dependent methyltransferase [Halobacteriota archaeon]